MARVLVATQPWGILLEKNPTSRGLSVPVSGQLAAINTTVYTASTGGTTISAPAFVTDSNGGLPGYVEEGTHTLTVNGVAQEVNAVSGLVAARVTAVEGNRVLKTLVFNPVDYGADPTGVADSLAAFNAMQTAMGTRGKSVLMPQGEYFFSAPWTVNRAMDLKGASDGLPHASAGTVLKFAAGQSGIIFENSTAQFSTLSKLYIRSLSTIAGTDDGLRLRAHGLELDQVTVEGFGRHGFNIDSTGGNANCMSLRRCRANLNRGNGFDIRGADSNVISFLNIDATGNTGWGVDCASSNNLFLAPHADSNAAGAYRDSGNSNQWIAPYIEGGVGDGVTLSGVATVWLGTAIAPGVLTDTSTSSMIWRGGNFRDIQIGTGSSPLKRIHTVNIGVDLPSIAANTTIVHNVTTPAGTVLAGDRVIHVGIEALSHGLVIQGTPLVGATDVIAIRVSNLTAAAIDSPSFIFYFTILRV